MLDSRDEFVSAARRLARNRDRNAHSVFLSHVIEDTKAARSLTASLERRGIRTFLGQNEISAGVSVEEKVRDALEASAHMVVLVGSKSNVSSEQDLEIRSFLRQAAADQEPRLLIPFLARETDLGRVPKMLLQYNVTPIGDDYDAAADHVLDLIRLPVNMTRNEESTLRLRVSEEGDNPTKGASVTALAKNRTTINTVTDETGHASLKLLAGRTYTLLVGHPKHPSRIIESFDIGPILQVRLAFRAGVGSVIIHSTGHIPGLKGRLNPILDTSNRTYLYADNIAIDGGKTQPASFKVGEPLELEDAEGSRFKVVVKFIAGRTALLEHSKL